MKRLRPRWALLAVFALVLAGLGSACSAIEPPALTVGGTELSRSELFDQLPDFLEQSASSASTSTSGDYDPSQVAEFLTERAYIFLIQNELDARGLEPTQEDRDAVSSGSAPENDYAAARQEALAGREVLLRELGAEAGVDDAAVDRAARERYDQNPSTYGTPGSTCLSGIFVAAGEIDPQTGQLLSEPTDQDYAQALADIQAARAKVAAGQDFGAVAESDSDIPAEQAPNGQIGCLSDDEVASIQVESLATAIPELAVGEVSDPLRVDGGYYVLTVTERTEASIPAYDTVADQIRTQVRGELNGDAFDAWLNSQLETADISVDKRFGTWNAETRAVDPPTGATPASSTTTIPPLGGEVSPTDQSVTEEVG